ncbi:hypothetical protein DLJ49_20275 [Rhodovulum sp. 12E13]|nr:hypothetical protein DLJ49_20275 [Rhodovulum sp. 12E13]
MRLLAAASCLFVAQGVAVTAATTTITDGTTDYRITTVEGTPSALEALLKAQPWYTGSSDSMLAAALADDLGTFFQYPNVNAAEEAACLSDFYEKWQDRRESGENSTGQIDAVSLQILALASCSLAGRYGPFFAYDFDDSAGGAALSQASQGTAASEQTTPLGETATFAVLDTAVIPLPGGLPLLAGALAAGWAVARRRRGGAPAKP